SDLFDDAGALVEDRDEAAVYDVDAGAAIGQRGFGFVVVHGVAGRRAPVVGCRLGNPCFSSRTKDSSWISSDSLSAFFSISPMWAVPTPTPPAWPPISATCSGVDTPKPTASGRSVTSRIERINGATERLMVSRSPVTPVRDTRYTKPVEYCA